MKYCDGNKNKFLKKLFSIMLLISIELTSITPVVFAQEASFSSQIKDQSTPTPTTILEPTDSLTAVGTPTIIPSTIPTLPLSVPTGEISLPIINPTVSSVPSPDISVNPIATSSVTPVISPTVTPFVTFSPKNLEISIDNRQIIDSANIKQHIQILPLTKRDFQAKETIEARLVNAQNVNFRVAVVNAENQEIPANIQKETVDNEIILKIVPPPNFRPGKYSLKATYIGGIAEQNFTWGLLAINTNKSIYFPKEKAKFSFAVLDEQGIMVCDAKVTLKIQSEQAVVDEELSTENGKILVNPKCRQHDFALNPDYEASYQVKEPGNYHLTLTAQTISGTYTITDSFRVQESVPFNVERTATTRVDPLETYTMSLMVVANDDFSGTITETVPDFFDIKPIKDQRIKQYDEVKTEEEIIMSKGSVLGISAASLHSPFEGSHKITLAFGEVPTSEVLKQDLKNENLFGHDGVDFDMPSGTAIFAVDDGEVTLSGPSSYGTTIVLVHGWGKSFYGHLSKLLVKEGQKVLKGDKIALSGNTGISTAPHLHFGVKPADYDPYNGFFGKVDPLPYLELPGTSNVLGATTSNVFVKRLTWNVAVKKGDKFNLAYFFQTPSTSSQLYLVGPLKFAKSDQLDKDIFSETRQWQMMTDELGKEMKADHTPTIEEQQSFEKAYKEGRIGRKLPPPDFDFKDVAGDSGKTHNFEMKFPWNGMKVMLGDKKEGTVGYKLVSGYDPDFWLEVKMKELNKKLIVFRDIMKGKTPSVHKRESTFTVSDTITAKFQIQDDNKVKADYIVNKPLSESNLEFALDYPETDIIPVQNQDGAIEFHKSNGEGKALDFMLFLMEKPTAKDAKGKEVSVVMKLSGKTVTLTLNAPSDAVYPITIDPTTIDASAIAAATAYGNQRKLFKDFNGSLIAVYMTTGSDLEAEWSNDSGVTWSATGPVVATTITSVGAAMDSQGNIHAVTAEAGIKYRKLTITRTGTSITSAAWTASAVGLDSATIAKRPSVIVDTGNNLPAVAWAVETTGGTKSSRVRFMRAKTISGTPGIADWCNDDASACGTAAGTTYCAITPGTTNVCNDGSSLAISASNTVTNINAVLSEIPVNGNLLIWWTDAGLADLYRIQGTRATDAASGKPSYKWAFTATGTQYAESTAIGTNSTTGFDLTAVLDTVNNRIVLAFSDGASNLTTVKYRSNSIAESVASTDISVGVSVGTQLSLSAGSINGADGYLLAYKTSGGFIGLRNYTSSWSSETILDQATAVRTYPSLRADSKSHVADQSSTTTTASSDFGRADNTYVKLAECFTAGTTGKISQVALNLDKNGAPVDGIVVELLNYDIGTSKPGSTVLAGGGVAATELTTSSGWFYVPLNTSYSVTSGTKYCLGVSRLATADNTNNYSWYRGTTSTLANADGYYYDASGWSAAQTWDFAFYSYYESTVDADKPKYDLIYTDSTALSVIYHTWHINETYSRTKDATPIALPSNANDLVILADQSNYDQMATDDTSYTTITGLVSSANYNIFLYRRRNISGTSVDTVTATIVARSSVACSATNGTVYLKIFNYDTGTWDDFDSAQSNNTCSANTDFTFTATRTTAAGYYDSNKYVAVRMYQDAGEGSAYNLTTDRVAFSFATPSTASVVQRSYRWEDDDGSNPNQNTAVAAADTDVTGVKKGERFLARFQLDTGAWTSQYELQYGSTTTPSDACSTVSSWNAVTTTSAISQSWAISGNSGDRITSRKAAVNANTRHDGLFIEQDPDNTANYITAKYKLPASSFTEHVFAVNTSNATLNTKYCLRLKDYTNNLPLTYTGNKYPALTIVDTTNDTIRYSKGAPTALAADTSNLTFPLDDLGYANVSSDNGVRDTVKASLLKNIPTRTIFENPTATNSENFGYSVASAGDVNGDGYSDVIVGAYGYTTNRGRAYIFFGSSSPTTPDSTADVVLENPTATNSENFGYSVASAGDVNGDGYSDVIVGAYGYTTNRGRAYIYKGSSGITGTISSADVVLENPTATNSENFGYSVASAGDVNGDGYADVIVGAYGYNNSSIVGRAYIYKGSSGITGTISSADVVLENPTATINEYFGSSVTSAGDVNGDGYSDVIVGAYGYTTYRGRAYIYKGSSGITGTISSADVVLENPTAVNNGYFGIKVASAGDFNGDGYADVIVGSLWSTINSGRAYIYKGSSGITGTISSADVVLENPTGTNSENFGYSVASAGDVNGDGYSDVIVGAYGYTTNRGRAYIFFGSSSPTTPDSTADVVLENPTATNSEFFGFSVASAGDVNGDGYSDVVVGAYQYSTTGGRAYTFYNGFSILENPTATDSEFFGFSVASAGDFNGDGYADVIVGAYGYTTSRGRAYIYFGSASGIRGGNANVVLENPTATNSEKFGYTVASAGDINGDGYSDVIVGATNAPSGGRAYIFFGSGSPATPDSTADVILVNPPGTADLFSSSIDSGDINGDGYSDVFVGADYYTTNRGRAYIYFGSSSISGTVTSANVTLEDPAATNNDHFSYVAFVGDVNGDGYFDMAVGATQSGGGNVYIYFGSSSISGTITSANVTLINPTGGNSALFGGSINGDDVNGDGYSDVIVGALGETTNRGRAYIFFGSANMSTSDNTADVVFENPTATNNEYFGYSAKLRDINNDGYADIVVTASAYPGGASANMRGRAYIYFGSSSISGTITSADIVLENPTATNGEYFGRSVASARDVNGDGYSDVTIGAYGYSAVSGTAQNRGRVYTYFGGASTTTSLPEFLFAVKNSNATDNIAFSWNGSSSQTSYSMLDTSAINTLKLKVEAYKQSSACTAGTGWTQVGNLSAVKNANVEFTLARSITNCPSDYYDGNNRVFLRISQTSTTGILRTDNISITFSSTGGPTVEQVLRHGLWFSSGVKQPFTF